MRKLARTTRLLQDILAKNLVERPFKTALICDNRRLTYAQIDEMSNRMANALQENGVENGDRILFYLMNSAELVIGIFAALKAGAIFSVVDYANTFETLYEIAADCAASALVTYDHQTESAVRLLKEVSSLRFAVLAGLNPAFSIPHLIPFDSIQEKYPADALFQGRIDCDLAYLIYTSGSTGLSKGVMVTHRSILFTIDSGAEYLNLSESDIHASPLPLSFSPGINQLFQTFLVGGTLILEKSFAFPAMTLKRIETEHATSFASVPTILALLLQMDLGRYDLSRLRFISSIGAALPTHIIRQIRERLPHVNIFSTYGMAEASYSLGLAPEQIDLRPTAVGKPFPGLQAWIVDEHGRRLGPDQIGELIIRGGNVRSGYWNDPEKTALRFRPGPVPGEQVCHSGDMFRMDEDGYFYFQGRSDEIIKSGAKKVAPMEIENVLYSHESVLEAAAVGVPDPLLGQAIKAFITLKKQGGDSTSTLDILKYCQQKLEAYKVPREVEIRDRLPKTPSGKIIKTDLA